MTSPASASTWQRRALLAGAALDVAFAIPMLVAPGPASRLLRLALPADPVWFQLCAVLLLIASGCYIAASRAEESTLSSVAIVAGLGRCAGAWVLAGGYLRSGEIVLLVTAFADGALGVTHLVLARRQARALARKRSEG